MADTPKVVILGAGFGGVAAAHQLQDVPVQVTLLDKNDYHTFQPLLYQVATDELAPSTVGFPVRELLHHQGNLLFHQAAVTGVDLGKRQVQAEGMDPLPYDYLVIGLGAQVNFFGTQGAAEHAFPLYTMEDAVRLKRHILEQFEAVDKKPALLEDGALNFVIVGGGPTGVETAGAVAELLHAELKKDYPNLPVEKARVLLFERGPALLAPFKENLRTYAKQALEERGVEVRLGEGVTAITPTSVILTSGEEIEAHTLIWGAGLQANPLAKALGIALGKGGRIPVNPDLSLADHPEVFVVGDIALITDAKTQQVLPQLGSAAEQAGKHAGVNIAHRVNGKATAPFEYANRGIMATVGRGAAVVEMPHGQTLTGTLAWLAWLGVHLTLLSGGVSRTDAFVDWGWMLLTHQRGKRIVLE